MSDQTIALLSIITGIAAVVALAAMVIEEIVSEVVRVLVVLS